MADGESPKARPKRVKPDRPRPTTSSFRPTGGGSRPGASARPSGQRPGGQRTGGPRPGGHSGQPGGNPRPDSRIPRGPDDWSAGDRPAFDRPSFDRPSSGRPSDRPGGRGRDERPGGDRAGGRPWPGRPQGDRPRFAGPRTDGPRPERSGFGFRGRQDGPPRWQDGPQDPGERSPRDQPPSRDEGRRADRPAFRDQGPRRGFNRPGERFERPAPARQTGFDNRPGPRGDEAPFEPPRPRPPFDRPFRPDPGRPGGQRSFGARPERPWVERGRPAYSPPAAFNRPGLEPAEAGLVEGDDEIVAGRRPVEEAFVARREARRLLVVPQRRGALEKLVLHATSLRIPIVEVEGGSLTALTGFDGHQGIALVVAPRRYASVADILARATERNEAPFVLVLDSLEDPQNVGTLLRSAEAAGAHGVIFPTRRQAPLSPAAVKASAGAVEHLLLAPVDDLAGALADLHIAGLRVVGAEAEAPLTVREADLRGPLAMVVGSEGQGLGPAVRRRCDLMVRIPMRGVIGSLNASVAGSILLFEATTQRAGPEAPPVLKPRAALPAVPRPASVPRETPPAVAEGDAVGEPATEPGIELDGAAPEPQVESVATPSPKQPESVKAPSKAVKVPAKPVKTPAKPAKAPKAKLAKGEPKTGRAPKRSSKAVKGAAASATAIDEGNDLLP
ncbi:MAG TPA: 23S rRNA (guanosine(2251)-2'-O)-methyltransferase RlmB [Candidatus Limnocylindrales bacterium]